MKPDYSKYSIEQLYSVKDVVNKDNYPERYKEIIDQLELRINSNELSESDQEFIENSKGDASKIGCERIIKQGLYGGIVLALLSFAIAILSGQLENGIYDGVVTSTVFLLLSLALIVKSRVASSLLFSLYLVERLYQWVFLQQLGGTLLGLIFLTLLYRAMKSTFIWHKRYSEKSS